MGNIPQYVIARYGASGQGPTIGIRFFLQMSATGHFRLIHRKGMAGLVSTPVRKRRTGAGPRRRCVWPDARDSNPKPWGTNRSDPIFFSQYLYRARHRAERFFNKIKQCRRVATRYDRLAANYLAFVQLASIRLWLRLYEFAS